MAYHQIKFKIKSEFSKWQIVAYLSQFPGVSKTVLKHGYFNTMEIYLFQVVETLKSEIILALLKNYALPLLVAITEIQSLTFMNYRCLK